MSTPAENPHPPTGALAVVANAVAANAAVTHTDPARRPDVLFRVRREEGHQPSAWWSIGAFVVVSGIVLVLFSFVPGGA
ncbi:UDP-N-acetylmuramyl pentapeptide phosphotransferase [Microbacterium sp. NPDC089189]|uniref:UDP-N-acetylmuramyl pentapeptide phosphotransferase n=1 Tax=Microbacterium sp. NPDC089189 TaxID=3154972 RepID=UPI00341208AC